MPLKQRRVERTRELARAAGLSAVVVMPGPNLLYLAELDLHLSERAAFVVIPVDGEPWAVSPQFEVERIAGGAGIQKVYAWSDGEGPVGAVQHGVAESGLGAGKVGLEYLHMRILERELLAGAVAAAGRTLQYQDAGAIFAALRSVKDDEEIAATQRATTICDAACKAAQEAIRPGVTEAQVAAYITRELEKLGVQGGFQMHVASGPRSAIPHAATSDRVMQEGELVWVDFYGPLTPYVGDITRTFPVGKVTGKLADIYRICLEAQTEARATARPGMSGGQIDAVARDYIARAGYGEYFTHRLGHGIGVEVHEEPYIVAGNDEPLVPGNVFTIEPGIYVPGLGGVRIEDDMLMTETGARTLTNYPRDLIGG